MKQFFTLAAIFFHVIPATAQLKGNAEFMPGHRYIHYMHSLSHPLSQGSAWGWQHIATFIKPYQTEKRKPGQTDELMNQLYLTRKLAGPLSLKGGFFYTNTGGYMLSTGIQLLVQTKDWLLVVSPRADIAPRKNYELFLLTEYAFPARSQNRWFVRVQAMSNAGVKHNRSYQLLRTGINIKTMQLGAGITFDEYGTGNPLYCNTGFFIRKQW